MTDAIRVKRIYEPADEADGQRILVDRLWPRGVSKDQARLTGWMKTLGPSHELRKAFHSGELNWGEFCARYDRELDSAAAADAVTELLDAIRRSPVTLLFGARNEAQNNAVALRNWLLQSGFLD